MVIVFLGLSLYNNHRDMIYIKGGKIVVSLPSEKQKTYLKTCDPTGFKMMQSGQRAYYNENIQILVTSFLIDKYPVSMDDYIDYCRARKIAVPTITANLRNKMRTKNLPMVGVTWDEANAYCQYNGKRLPTKQEYEFMLFRNDFFPFDIYQSLTILHKNEKVSLLAIGENKIDVNNLGVVDIYSNTFEITSSDACELHQNNYLINEMQYCKELRILKKAPFNFNCKYLNIFSEEPVGLSDRYLNIGFRCAMDAE